MQYLSMMRTALSSLVLVAAVGCDAGDGDGAAFEAEAERGATDVFVLVGGYGYSQNSSQGSVGPWKLVGPLRQRGYDVVFADSVTPKAGTDVRGTELWAEFVEPLCAQNKRVHLIAHSQGGLAARYLIEVLGESKPQVRSCIESLTTVGTPHHGTKFASFVKNTVALLGGNPGIETLTPEWVAANLPNSASRRGAVRYFTWAGLAWDTGSLLDSGKLDYDDFYSKDYQDIRKNGMLECDGRMYDPSRYALGQKFVADALVPYYPNWPGKQSQHDFIDRADMKNFQRVPAALGGYGPYELNDGWIELASARLLDSWASGDGIEGNVEFLGCIPADHFDMAAGGRTDAQGDPVDASDPPQRLRTGYDVVDFYAYNIERILYLKGKGALQNPGGACRSCALGGGGRSCAGLCTTLGAECGDCVASDGGTACVARCGD